MPLCPRARPLSRDVTHLSVLATSANIPNTFATIHSLARLEAGQLEASGQGQVHRRRLSVRTGLKNDESTLPFFAKGIAQKGKAWHFKFLKKIMKFDPVDLLKKFVSYPSVSADSKYKNGVLGARDFVAQTLSDIGFSVEQVPTPLYDVIIAKRHLDPSYPTVIIYGHYDVQPADPFDLWESDPFTGTVRGDRLYARGASDNKGCVVTHICALAELFEEYPDLPLNITYLVEGEEEIGSPSFANFLEENKEKLQGDFIVLSDTGIPSEEQIVITTGLRGLLSMELGFRSAKLDLHSGVHGGAILNPIQAMTEFCASLHDHEQRVTVPGFYDDVQDPTDWERDELQKYTQDEESYKKFLGVKRFHPEEGFSPFEAIRFRPTLEFNGIGGGYQGEGSKTVIPSKAFVKMTCRLVPNQDPQKIAASLQEMVADLVPDHIEVEVKNVEYGYPYGVLPGHRVPASQATQNPLLQKTFPIAEKAILDHFGTAPLYLREGGSIPIIANMKEILGLDSLMIGLSTHEDKIHSPNESFHLGLQKKAIQTFKDMFIQIAKT